jgi:putative acyl-CoA dehydrogenase
VEALLAELKTTAGADERLDAYVAGISARLNAAGGEEHSARDLTEKLALALQASLVVRHSSPAIAEAFIASRLAGQHGHAFGTLPARLDTNGILDVAGPQ